MKIAAIVSIFPKLSETFVLNQISGLIQLGHDVRIIAGINPKENKIHEDFYKLQLKSKTDWLPRIKIWRGIKAFFLFAYYFAKAPKLLIQSINFFKYGRDAISLRIFYCLIPMIKHSPFDIIYCHFGENGKIGAILKEIGVEGKLVSTFYGKDITYKIKKFGGQYYKRLFEYADLLLPVCEFYKNILLEIGVKSDKILVHRMGIHPERFKFRVRKFSTDSHIKILTVCRLVEKKGLEYSIQAYHQTLKKSNIVKMSYDIVGDGPLQGNLGTIIKGLNLQDEVELKGAMDQKEISLKMNNSDIFILSCIEPNDGDLDAIPLVLMEAMASGMPVISTRISGIPELIIDGQNGFLAVEKNADSITEKLASILENPHQLENIVRSARKQIETNFNVNKLNKRLEETFESLISL